ncbi:hypothetical protein ACH42_04605 [Endozoicomonas sp. (ex Bugula neritina AB1)]|nr:hypothetical protein ACH42_04605 [Endozoicomonas sp. (ex Bugula neritina AB1)]
MAATQSILMEVDSKLANTRLVAMAVRGLCAITTLSPVEINRLELCLVEVVNNAIEHAYGNKAGHRVEILVELEETQLSITISDWGAVMPGKNLEVRELKLIDPELPETVLCSGRGLHIVRNLMDALEYSSHQGKNSLLMVKQLRH